MIDIKEKYNCSGCSACFNICPRNCIEMKQDEEGFAYPVVDESKCIKCGLCTKACPILNKQELKQTWPKAYAGINKNQEIRMKSSSGGAFSAFAEYVLERNGVVFGAGFDEDFNVCHQYVESIEDLDKLRRSKYVQSFIGDSYKIAKKFLDEGRLVLFTGTPCHISGLKSFLRKEYENLITQDLICMGVPSPLVWGKYVELKSKGRNLKLSKINFRDKRTGWEKSSFSMAFGENEEVYHKRLIKDPYIKMFLYKKILRPSCHKCSFKGISRQSDITLADFWGGGFKKVAPHMNDNKGCSLVIIHSEKGQEIFDALQDKIDSVEVDSKIALKGNPMMRKSAMKSIRRYFAMKSINKIPFDKYVKKYGKVLY